MAIIMHLLSRQEAPYKIGATKKEILRAISINPDNKNADVYFHNLIKELSEYIEPIGLQIKFNPIDKKWFIIYENEVAELLQVNPFDGKPRLAATLFCCIVCCLKNSGIAKIHEIKELRKKENLIEDLKELEQRGYLVIDKDLMQVKITSLLGYHLDLYKIIIKLALKIQGKNK